MTTTRPLILTGHSATWPQPLYTDLSEFYFLGPWCFAYNEATTYDQGQNHKILKGTNTSADQILTANLYVDELCERLMPAVGELLNRLHTVSKSEKFWRKVSLYWLIHWVGIIHDRYSRLKSAEAETEGKFKWFVELPRVQSRGEFENYGQMMAEIDKHTINLALFSDVLRFGNFKLSRICKSLS
ncbi:MAG: hypothetical protein EOP04_33440 [Proteobacteria bacterium]|nr:MAG: hypothetical protein EOP04_33440 [Pseudomonadota bacterium]